MTRYCVVRDYPHPITEVWQVLTDPALVAQWTTAGQGGRPQGFSPAVGTHFQFVAKPTRVWRGIVDCEVIRADAPHGLSYTWRGDERGETTVVTYYLTETTAGTRFTWEHTGFTGVGGWFMAQLLGSVRRKMLSNGVPRVLTAQFGAGASKTV